MTTVSRSKIDTWIAVVLIFGVFAPIGGAVSALGVAPDGMAWTIALLVVAAGAGLPTWLLTTTYYRIDADTLLVSSGPVRLRVPIREIE